MKKLTVLILILTLLLTLVSLPGCSNQASPGDDGSVGGGSANPQDGKVYELNFSFPMSAESPAGKLITEYSEMMEEQSGGRLKIVLFPSNTLLSPLDAMNGVINKIADIAYVPGNAAADYWPINYQLLSMPFMGYPNTAEMSDIYAQLCEEFPEIEEELLSLGIMSGGTVFSSRFDIHFAKSVEIRKPEDLVGKKVASMTPALGTLLSSMGAAPVSITNADAYTSLDNGVAEGIVSHMSLLESTRTLDLIKTVVLIGDGGMLKETYKYVMNTEVFNGLPSDLQAIVADGLDGLGRAHNALDSGRHDELVAQLEAQGAKIIVLTEEEAAEFAAYAEPIHTETIAKLEGQGINAQAIYDRARELAQSYR